MISLIVAYDKNRCIGKKNTIPWKIKADMLRVKELTTNQTILMGRKTYESIGKPLPNRINRVLTRSLNYTANGIEIYHDFDMAIKNIQTEKLFIFGGSQIYEQYIDKVEEMYISEIQTCVVGDSFFPKIDMEKWIVVSCEEYDSDEDNEYNYKFIHLKRK
ncbi:MULTISPECIES: dihydrofolate reductase [unclassified Gemella]|uniref:dihydrofolate reductase n=1 Tax=unclassified Gemella TaxID=2624949 RepID=UPI001073BCEE|nr:MULTISPECIES: dihydrofolate reductase [unclassified Gemella]MBF0710160.1 dihydrofolate reductase [Gemella sp. GL1.1]MBF0746239.1 dihydrofolate reductase [Gemella sp. 19428wG2_WT2a]NYS27504.1 dihydrofolate reductase [Gemella sp. GL1]TFU60521.1 dihydrofolate reductase [Gemella sp. WT2a]